MGIKERQRNELWNLRQMREGGVHDDGTPLSAAELEELDADIANLERIVEKK